MGRCSSNNENAFSFKILTPGHQTTKVLSDHDERNFNQNWEIHVPRVRGCDSGAGIYRSYNENAVYFLTLVCFYSWTSSNQIKYIVIIRRESLYKL